MSYLKAEALVGGYGGAMILNSCTIAVDRGRIAVIVGPNGAGKSTAMKAILGLLRLTSGRVLLDGRDITALPTQARISAGMAFVPQTDNVFPSLSVFENLQMGALLRRDPIGETLEEIFALFPILAEKRHQLAGQLSGGQRQQLAVGRALMTRPSVLLLDEPTAGVSPNVMDELFDRITRIAAQGLAVVRVDQNAAGALEIADTGFVLVQGANRFTGAGRDLLNDPDIRRSFLGGRK